MLHATNHQENRLKCQKSDKIMSFSIPQEMFMAFFLPLA